MTTTAGPAAAAGDFLDALAPIADASPAVMLAAFVIALWRRWLILPRELDTCQARLAELETERDEWKRMTLDALTAAERVTSAVERRGPT